MKKPLLEKSVKHVAMIMDGNGRWAKMRGLNRVKGHEKGAEVVRDITQHCNDLGIEYLTLYAFSTENWKRPKMEVEFLFKLLIRYLKNEQQTYCDNNIRFETIGDLSFFPKKLQDTIQETKELTAHHTGLTQVIALNYGGRDEIVRAVNHLIHQGCAVTQESLNTALDTGTFPPLEILIRTSGEVRLSNFLLWQVAYAELFFTETLWPDFTSGEFNAILTSYLNRERRFGGL